MKGDGVLKVGTADIINQASYAPNSGRKISHYELLLSEKQQKRLESYLSGIKNEGDIWKVETYSTGYVISYKFPKSHRYKTYDLFTNNCTTFVSGALKHVYSDNKEINSMNIVMPREMDNYMFFNYYASINGYSKNGIVKNRNIKYPDGGKR